MADHTAVSVIPYKFRLHGFCQPQAAGTHCFHLSAGPQPELKRHQRGHVAAEAVHDLRPAFQRLDLVVPQAGIAVVQINDIRPFADPVAEAAVRLMVEPFRVMLRQPRVRGRVVVYHVDHQLHPAAVDGIRQMAKVLHRAVFRVDGPVIRNGVGRPQRTLAFLLADRVNGQQPHRVRPQRPNARNILFHGSKVSTVIAHKDGIDRHIAQFHVSSSSRSKTSASFRGQDSSTVRPPS